MAAVEIVLSVLVAAIVLPVILFVAAQRWAVMSPRFGRWMDGNASRVSPRLGRWLRDDTRVRHDRRDT
jgi:hypothetical protein